MLIRLSNNEGLPNIIVEGSHIYFRNFGTYFEGREHKTKLFEVYAKADNFKLGEIRWFGRWRKYVFEPTDRTIYEETCMRDISQFIEEETKTHRTKAKALQEK